jgi:hypothetical protein
MAYGMRPVTHGGYNYQTGGFEEFPIADNYDTEIYNGDLVILLDSGTIARFTTTLSALGPVPLVGAVGGSGGSLPANPVLGVFVGCRYDDANSTPAWAQYWGTSGTNAFGFVVTDPNAVFKSQYVATWNDNLVGETCDVTVVGADSTAAGGSTATGNSANSIPASTTNLGFRIIGVIRDGKNETASVTTPDILVRYSSPSVQLYGYQTLV